MLAKVCLVVSVLLLVLVSLPALAEGGDRPVEMDRQPAGQTTGQQASGSIGGVFNGPKSNQTDDDDASAPESKVEYREGRPGRDGRDGKDGATIVRTREVRTHVVEGHQGHGNVEHLLLHDYGLANVNNKAVKVANRYTDRKVNDLRVELTEPASPASTRSSSPGSPAQGDSKMMLGLWICLGIVAVGGTLLGIFLGMASINVRRLEQVNRTNQIAQLGVALTNQNAFRPAAGFKTHIAATLFQDGGGMVIADSDGQQPAPQVNFAPQGTPAVVVTHGGGVHIHQLNNPQQPAQAAPVAINANLNIPPAPPAPAAPPAGGGIAGAAAAGAAAP